MPAKNASEGSPRFCWQLDSPDCNGWRISNDDGCPLNADSDSFPRAQMSKLRAAVSSFIRQPHPQSSPTHLPIRRATSHYASIIQLENLHRQRESITSHRPWLIKFRITFRITISWMMLVSTIGVNWRGVVYVCSFGRQRAKPIQLLEKLKRSSSADSDTIDFHFFSLLSTIDDSSRFLSALFSIRLAENDTLCVESFPIISIRLMILSIYVSQIIPVRSFSIHSALVCRTGKRETFCSPYQRESFAASRIVSDPDSECDDCLGDGASLQVPIDFVSCNYSVAQ